MKTKTLLDTNKVSEVYTYNDMIIFYPINNKLSLSGYQTTCKEEIGSQCVRHKYNKFIMALPRKLTDKQVDKILNYIHIKEKEAKVFKTVIERVQDKSNWLFVEHSRRWSRNSVAHSILITWLRFTIASHIESMYEVKETDKIHISSCFWLLNIVKNQGLRIFGTMQHPYYDVGMVSFMYHVKNKTKFVNQYELDEQRNIFDEYPVIDELSPGELDGPLPSSNTHAYTKLIKMYENIS